MASKKELAAELQRIIDRHSVDGKAANEITELKAALGYCVNVVLHQERTGRALHKDYKREGLTANAVEAEGFIRGCITIMNELRDWSPVLSDVIRKEEKDFAELDGEHG